VSWLSSSIVVSAARGCRRGVVVRALDPGSQSDGPIEAPSCVRAISGGVAVDRRRRAPRPACVTGGGGGGGGGADIDEISLRDHRTARTTVLSAARAR
jgi:hypothetical protein